MEINNIWNWKFHYHDLKLNYKGGSMAIVCVRGVTLLISHDSNPREFACLPFNQYVTACITNMVVVNFGGPILTEHYFVYLYRL